MLTTSGKRINSPKKLDVKLFGVTIFLCNEYAKCECLSSTIKIIAVDSFGSTIKDFETRK